jgi:hypothetical protein
MWKKKTSSSLQIAVYFYFMFSILIRHELFVREPFEKFGDWRQCTAVIQREAVNVMPCCSGAGNVLVAWSSFL